MRVLIVDDSSTMRKLLKKILVEVGAEVLEAKHGLEALEVLRQNVDIGLTSIDWNMPEMDGMQLLERIRANHSFDSMQIMMVTTEMEMSGVARALEVGANEYVMKPFTKDVILEKLQLLGLLRESAPSAL